MMHLNIRWVLPGLAVIMVTTIILLSSTDTPIVPQIPVTPQPLIAEKEANTGFLVNTPGCRMPLMEPFDRSIRKYLRNAKNYVCDKQGPLVESNQTALWVNFDVVRKSGYRDEEISCCYQPIWRNPQVKLGADSNILSDETCHVFENSANIYDEYVRVICYFNDSEIYKDFHAFIVPKENDARSTLKQRPAELRPSVLIIGIDSISRLNFYRQMPKTLDLLKSWKAIELLGYNKVDDNTFPNLVPVLTGHSVNEIKETCWKSKDEPFDSCPFIWKKYREKGYVTGFGEDACWMGLFQYLKRGFIHQPVDYYLHTMMTRAEKETGHIKDINSYVCLGRRLTAKFLTDFTEKIVVNLTRSDTPFFGFYWGTSLSHDYLNPPPQLDETYVNFFKALEAQQIFNNTLILFMSDHGMRWGPIRETYQGRVEERLPFVFAILPEWFKEKYPLAVSNLRRNRNMLTSPFDIHETLKDMMDIQSLEKFSVIERSKKESTQRGLSLFLQHPYKRTCEDAGIPENWCTCHESRNASVDNAQVKKAANTVVDYLNDKLFQYFQCAKLTLHEIKSAMLESSREEVRSSSARVIQDWTIVLVTSPGMGEFESIVREHLYDGSMAVLGYVSRINAYGNQSRCVDDFRMRLYCYCP